VFSEAVKDKTRLPRVFVPRWSRFAGQVQSEIERRWGLKTILLDCFYDASGADQMIAAEVIAEDRLDVWHKEFSWTAFDNIPDFEISGRDRAEVQHLLTAGATGRGPFSRLGWTDELLNWVAGTADLSDSQISGELRQLNASADHTLIRIGRQDDFPFWFKAVGATEINEFQLTATVARLFPEYVPTVVASREDWNGWLMKHEGWTLDQFGSPYSHRLEQVGKTLADLQRASIMHVDTLIAEGFQDLRGAALRTAMNELMPQFEEAVRAQTSDSVPPVDITRVRELRLILDDAASRLEQLGIPDALVHNDLSVGNILLGTRCVFTDWAGAAVGNPFVALENLRVHLSQDGRTAKWMPYIVEAYRKRWRTLVPDGHIEQALSLTPLITLATHLCRHKDCLVSDRPYNPGFQGYMRSLLRQMDHAARSMRNVIALSA
jgi:hypothetical protein